eukprot:9076307-Pyramimonas_sp.AAC.1
MDGPRGKVRVPPPRLFGHTSQTDRGPQGSPPIWHQRQGPHCAPSAHCGTPHHANRAQKKHHLKAHPRTMFVQRSPAHVGTPVTRIMPQKQLHLWNQ